MAGKVINVAAEVVLADGLVAIAAETLRELLPLDGDKGYARKGVILANERKTVSIMHGDGANARPVEYTVSVYVQRAPLDDDEALAVSTKAAGIDARKAEKADEEQTKRERETKRAFELGQSATFGAMQNISTLVQAASALKVAGNIK